MRELIDDADTVSFRLRALLGEAELKPTPRLHVNSDGLVLEYTSQINGKSLKYYEKVSRFKDNFS